MYSYWEKNKITHLIVQLLREEQNNSSYCRVIEKNKITHLIVQLLREEQNNSSYCTVIERRTKCFEFLMWPDKYAFLVTIVENPKTQKDEIFLKCDLLFYFLKSTWKWTYLKLVTIECVYRGKYLLFIFKHIYRGPQKPRDA